MVPDGVVVAGGSAPGASEDAWILKLGTSGEILWQRMVGGSASEEFMDIAADPDGRIVGVGDVELGMGVAFIVLIDHATGGLVGQKIVGAGDGEGFDAVIAHDGGYYAAGSTQGQSIDGYIVRFDASLEVLWQRTIAGSASDNLFHLAPRPGGGIIVAGATMSVGAGNIDALLLAVDGDGNLQWSRTWGGTAIDQAWSVTTRTNAIYVGGRTSSFGSGDADGLLMGVDYDGNLLWAHTIGGPDEELVYDLDLDGAGQLVLGGRSGDWDLSYAWLAGFDPASGLPLWGSRFAPEGYQVFDAAMVVGDRLVAAGFTEVDDSQGDSDFIVISTDLTGQIDGGCGTAQSSLPTVGTAGAPLADASSLSWQPASVAVNDGAMTTTTCDGVASDGCL